MNSFDLSVKFNKEHYHILRYIKNSLEKGVINEEDFILSHNLDSYGRKRKVYEMNEKGKEIMINRFSLTSKKKKSNKIYVLKHKNIKKYYKIGITRDIENRIKSLNTASPTGIEIVYLIECENPEMKEKELHEKLNSKRTNGEWFKVELKDIEKTLIELDLLKLNLEEM